MDRRYFLKSSAAATATAAAAAVLPWREAFAAAPGWRTFETVTRVEIEWPKGVTRAWVPLPMPPTRTGTRRSATPGAATRRARRCCATASTALPMLYARMAGRKGRRPAGGDEPLHDARSRRRPRRRRPRRRRMAPPKSAPFYTAPTELIPTDGIVRETALEITKGENTDVEKARAIYEWVVDNTFRDPKVRGCGWGDIKAMLETRQPRRQVRRPERALRRAGALRGRAGARRLRPARGEIRARLSQPGRRIAERHPRAALPRRVLRAGHGWVPVDPADVRKVALEEPPGNLPLNDPKVTRARERLFGCWEMNWLAYNTGHDLQLPHSSGAEAAVPHVRERARPAARCSTSSIRTRSSTRSPRARSKA